MAEQKEGVAGTPGAEEQEENLTEGFISESYTAGELDVDESDEEESKEEETEKEKPAPDVPEDDDKAQEQSADDEEEEGDTEYSERVRARISKLTRKRRDAERRLRDLELENARLKTERESAPPAEVKKESEPPTRSEKRDEKPALSSQEAPDPKKYRYGSLDNDYIADLSKFNARAVIEEERKAYREQQEKNQRELAQQEYDRKRQAVYERGEVEIDDFEDVVIGGSISEQNPDGWVASPLMADLILDSEVGHKVAYHLAKNPAESRDIYAKSTYEQTRYFNKIEAKFLKDEEAGDEKDEEAGDEQEAPPKKTVKAPPKAPPPPTKPRGAGGNFEPSSQTDDFLAFEKMVRDKGLI